MKKYIDEIPLIMKNDRSLNILFVGMALYFAILGIFNGQYLQAVYMTACILVYLVGAMLGGIRSICRWCFQLCLFLFWSLRECSFW